MKRDDWSKAILKLDGAIMDPALKKPREYKNVSYLKTDKIGVNFVRGGPIHLIEYTAFEKLKADAQLLKEALEICEKELFRFNCEAPLELTAIDKPVYLLAREALEKFNAEGWGK